MSLLSRVAELEASGAKAAVVTVVKTSGSTPRESGAKMIVLQNGQIEGTIGGGRIEHSAIEAAIEVIETGHPQLLEFKLTQELGMCCGGQATVFIESITAAPQLIIFGAGHVGAALARAADAAGFDVHVADEREELLARADLPQRARRYELMDDPDLPFGRGAYVMITTHDHALDQRLVEQGLARPFTWLGVIGSRRKAELTRQRLRHKDFDDAAIERVRIPVGLGIGAETPEEIAVSILAELIAWRRGRHPRIEPMSVALETK